MDYDVVIVGGGPVGLIAAKEIAGAGYKACVVEEHQEIGYPVQCSGLYSISGLKALDLSLDDSIISNTIRGGRFYSPLGREFTAYSNVERARVVEKKLFDKYLAKEAARAGGEFKLKTKAEEIAVNNGVRVRTEGIYGEETLESELIICADGVRSTIARQWGLETPKKIVAAIQVEVDDVDMERDIAEVYFGRRYAPNFYAWILPKENTYEVGLGIRRPEAKLSEYLARFMRQHPVASKKICGSSFVEMNVGAFAVETIDRSVAERALIVGDAAGQVKASTGGGVITGGIAARIAGKACVKALEEENYSQSFLKKHYEDRWRAEIGLELQMHEALRELFDSLSDEELEEFFDLAIEERIDELMVKYQDTDKPSEFVKELLKNERMLSAMEKFLNYDVLAGR
jgi:geranylgeranyl reductase family protein